MRFSVCVTFGCTHFFIFTERRNQNEKTLSLILALVLCLSLCACGGNKKLTPEERLSSETNTFIIAYLDESVGDLITGTPKVDIVSTTLIEENQWAVLGTATIITEEDNIELSTKFGVVATFDSANDEFNFSKVEFDEFE